MHKTRRIHVGDVPVGGGAPVAVQSMTKTRTEDVAKTVAQIRRLEKAGCEIVRVAVPNKKALRAVSAIKERISVPLIADVHFMKELAIGALEQGADCVRVNPGNLGGLREFRSVASAATRLGRSVRIGINSGSLEKSVAKRKDLSLSEKLIESALRYLDAAARYKLTEVKVSLKAFDVPETVAAYRGLARVSDVPLHVGITEAGDLQSGAIRSAVGLGILLSEGIGDTMRVSLTAAPEREVKVAWEILGALNLRRRGIEVVSCPTCGRCEANVEKMVAKLKKRTADMDVVMRLAVMGCEVNGPGEAVAADVGVALNRKGGGVLFAGGKIVKKVKAGDVVDAMVNEIYRVAMVEGS